MKSIHFGLVAVASIAITGLASADVIMDQIGSMDGSDMAGGVHGSQEFVDYVDYSIVAMDDFAITEAMNLTSASMVMTGWNGYAGDPTNSMGYTINIYSSVGAAAGDLIGDVASVWSDPVSWSSDWSGPSGHLLTFDLSGISLDAGTYWLGITPKNHFAAGHGQTGVMTSNIGDSSGHQANPGGGFGMPENWSAGDANYAYSLEGNAVPAPAALALLGLAGLAGRRRRS